MGSAGSADPGRARSRQTARAPGGLHVRQRVRHAKFGEGVVLALEGEGYHARARIDFPAAGGPKWLVVAYAKLERL